MHGPLQHVKTIHVVNDPHRAPPRFAEYVYYACVFYSIMGSTLGLSMAMLGAGMLAVLATFCVMHLGSQATTIYAPIAFPLGGALAFVVVQFSVHGESLTDGAVRGFITWILALLIVQALALRQGFFHRFALTAFVIGLTALRYLRVSDHASSERYARFGLEGEVSLANPNAIAAWFGFCAVYFIIVGIETKRSVVRVASWLAAVGCLYIIGLTVSRGTLLAVAVATIVALHRLLKRGFLPVLCLAVLSWIIYISGLFDQLGAFYAARGTEETGRLVYWPLILERFLNSPLAGVGVSQQTTYFLYQDLRGLTPHNNLLFIALTSGIIPLAFFVACWWRAAWSAFRAYTKRIADAPFYFPLLLYAFLIAQTTNMMVEPWMTVTLSAAMAADAPRRVRRLMVRQIRQGKIADYTKSWSEAGHRV